MNSPSNLMDSENDIKTFRRIRKTIGYLGISLPIGLFVLSFIPFFNTPLQASISNYYYTNFRELFTGVLCAVGLFLIRYKGYTSTTFWKNDNLLTNIAGYAALGVALFPTNPDCWNEKIYTLIPLYYEFLGYIHYGFALIFFVTLSIMSICVFTIGQKAKKEIPISILDENHIYKICGYVMLLLIILIPICSIMKVCFYSTFLLEAKALFLFGISWLTKGRALGDKGKIGRKIYRESN